MVVGAAFGRGLVRKWSGSCVLGYRMTVATTTLALLAIRLCGGCYLWGSGSGGWCPWSR